MWIFPVFLRRRRGGSGIAGLLVGILILAIIAVFLMAIPMSWKQLFEDFDEFPIECALMVATGIASCMISSKYGFKAGIITSAVVATAIEMALSICNGDGLSFWHFTAFPLVFAGMGVIPAGIGYVVRLIKEKIG